MEIKKNTSHRSPDPMNFAWIFNEMEWDEEL